MSVETTPHIGIVAGESSGDALGAGLISELKRLYPGCRFTGIGGPGMRGSGCKILYEMEAIELIGLDGLCGKLGSILRIRSALYQQFITHPPDIFIGIDVPDFNLTLEEKLKKKGIKTVHYVSPTVWAWRGYRINKIRRAVDHMLALFPFEADFYKLHNVPVSYVGHPIADEICHPDRERARKQLELEIDQDEVLVALLPGSRGSEIRRLAGVFADTVRCLSDDKPGIRFVLPFANEKVRKLYFDYVGNQSDLPITYIDGKSRLVLEACNIALLASGTAALEAALLERPHVVAYRVSTLTWWLFKLLRHVTFYSMPNQLLETPLIPELIQKEATAKNMTTAIRQLIAVQSESQELELKFRKLREQLRLGANHRAAGIVARIIQAGAC